MFELVLTRGRSKPMSSGQYEHASELAKWYESHKMVGKQKGGARYSQPSRKKKVRR